MASYVSVEEVVSVDILELRFLRKALWPWKKIIFFLENTEGLAKTYLKEELSISLHHGLPANIILLYSREKKTYNCVFIFPMVCKLLESRYLVFLSLNCKHIN